MTQSWIFKVLKLDDPVENSTDFEEKPDFLRKNRTESDCRIKSASKHTLYTP